MKGMPEGLKFSCGVDEAGRGPVIGPLVVSIVCADAARLRDIGARDSKALSSVSRERLDKLIRDNSDFVYTKEISAIKLNEMMDSINLNDIEENAYSEVISRAPFDCTIYVDSFDVNEERLSRKLSSRTGKRVVCEHKADAKYPSVSAASIVSKVLRDRSVRQIEEEYGTIGSGYPADPVTVEFLKESFERGTDLSRIARTHWKTYKNLYRKGRTGRLF